MNRKTLGIAAHIAVATISFSAIAAPNFPARPITVVVGFTPGGGADTVARIVTEQMAKTLGQPFVIENKPGAGTTLAASQVSRAAPDGYTLYLGSSILFGVDKLMYKSVKYDAKSFAPITQWTTAPMLLTVNGASDIHNVSDLVKKAKAGHIFFASSGAGGSPHLAALAFENQAGVKLTHVPFKGGAPAVQAVVANDVQLTFATPPSALPLMQAGRLRSLGVSSAERSALFPDMPTVAEQGVKGYDQSFWFGLFAPAGTDPTVVQKLYDASVAALKEPSVRDKLAQQGNDVKWSESPEAFAQWVEKSGNEHADLARQAGLNPE